MTAPVWMNAVIGDFGRAAVEDAGVVVHVLAEVVESSVGGMNEALRQTPAGQAKEIIVLKQ